MLSTEGYYPAIYEPEISAYNFPHYPPPDHDAHVVAKVIDKFGEIINATLSYSIDEARTWYNIDMKLVHGTLSNGTFLGIIPGYQESTLVKYKVYVEDQLGYFAFSNGEYAVSKDVTGPYSGDGSSFSPNNPASWESVTISSRLYDGGSGIKNVTVYYIAGESSRYTPVAMYPVFKDESGNITGDKWQAQYRGFIPPFPEGTVVRFYVESYDHEGNVNRTSNSYMINDPTNKEIRIDISVDELSMRTLTAPTIISIGGDLPNKEPFISVVNATYSEKGNARTIGIQLDNQRFYYYNEKHIPLRTSLPLLGNPAIYPFDHYDLNVTFAFPLPDTKIILTDERNLIQFGDKVTASWNIIPNPIPAYNNDNATIKEISVSLTRYLTSGLAIQTALVTVFLLLGGVFVLENTVEQLRNKLTITLGIFAFIFVLNQIIQPMKPIAEDYPTLADVLLFILMIGVIFYSVSSIISCRYSWYRGAKPFFIDFGAFLAIIIAAGLIISLYYPQEISVWLVPWIIFALGYGLLMRLSIIHRFISRIKMYLIWFEPGDD